MIKSLRELLTNRWQMPVALVGLALTVIAIFRVKPPPRDFSFEALEADILAMRDAGAFLDASNSAANLLKLSPPLPQNQQARLHDLIADIAYRSECKRIKPLPANLRLLLEHQAQAEKLGLASDAARRLRTARAHDWLNEQDQALQAYRDTLGREPDPDTGRIARLALVRLLEDDPTQREERQGYIDELLGDDGMPAAYLWRTLRSALMQALRNNDHEGATALLVRYSDRLRRSDLRGYHEYLWAWIYAKQGDIERAAPLINWVDQWLAGNMRADTEMDAAGFLPALNRILRADIELADERPQAALMIYDETLRLQLQGDVYVWATAGRIKALAALDRHDAAARALSEARQRLDQDPRELSEARPGLREALISIYERQREHGAHDRALHYLTYALELTESDERADQLDLLERLAAEHRAAAAQPELEAAAVEQHQEDAARAFEQAANLTTEINDRQAELLWQAATSFQAAGRNDGEARMLEQFVDSRTKDTRLPQALLRLGAVNLNELNFDAALKWYGRLATQYPELEEAARAQLMKTECLLQMGPDNYSAVETQLRELLENNTITPKAEVYRDALRSLCGLLHRMGRYADAIAKIEEFLALYPDDERQWELRLTLAEAYRDSGEQLAEKALDGDNGGRLSEESQRRIKQAADLFGAFVGDSGKSKPPGPAAQFERLASLAQGDCLMLLAKHADATAAEAALAVFKQITVRYQGEPIALSAQVRTANLLLLQGKVSEAARAVERARWLLRGLPEQANNDFPYGTSRATWEKLLNTVAASDLFKAELASVE